MPSSQTVQSDAKAAPVALTIAGSDSGGGAGIQADLRTFSNLGVYGTSAITCLTAQNPNSISEIFEVPPNHIREQLKQIADYYPIKAAKAGLLFNAATISTVVAFFKKHPTIKIVVDPLIRSTSGKQLLQDNAFTLLKEQLCPLATLLTPNLDEVELFLGQRPTSRDEMIDAGKILQTQFGCAQLIKGGHLNADTSPDVLIDNSQIVHLFQRERIPNVNTHGSGCTLSAAVTAFLAQNLPLQEAVKKAKDYLFHCISNPSSLNNTNFINFQLPSVKDKG